MPAGLEIGEAVIDRSLGEVRPESRDVDLAREALNGMRSVLDNPSLAGDEPVTITVEGGPDAIVVPKPVLEVLVRVLGSLSAGEGITVVPSHAELTTQQAADMLNVSRPHLVKLLSEGQNDAAGTGNEPDLMAIVVIYDANVLYPSHLRDVLIRVAGPGDRAGGSKDGVLTLPAL